MPEKKSIEGVENTIVVASTKGGVGKSTVAANIAAEFASRGCQTGLLDLDSYGPSVPTMFSPAEGERPQANDNEEFLPVQYGDSLELLSLGMLTESDQPVVWRGPMVGKAVQQLLFQVAWTEPEFLIIDLPPGTGDTQISLLQQLVITGAVMVTTPQELALSDMRKGNNMFVKMGASLLGIVENMAGFKCPGCGHQADIFGQGGGRKEARRLGIELLASLPIDPELRQTADSGEPLVYAQPDSKLAQIFSDLCNKIEAQIAQQAGDGD